MSTYEIIRSQFFLLLGLTIAAGLWYAILVFLAVFDHHWWAAAGFFPWLSSCLWLVYRHRLLLRLIKAAADCVDLEIQPETKQ